MICPGHHRFAAGRRNGFCYLFAVGRDDYMPGVCRHGALPDADDHWLATNVGKRFAGKPGRVHASRYDDQRISNHCGRDLWLGDKLSRCDHGPRRFERLQG